MRRRWYIDRWIIGAQPSNAAEYMSCTLRKFHLCIFSLHALFLHISTAFFEGAFVFCPALGYPSSPRVFSLLRICFSLVIKGAPAIFASWPPATNEGKILKMDLFISGYLLLIMMINFQPRGFKLSRILTRNQRLCVMWSAFEKMFSCKNK